LRKAKILITLGPASREPEIVEQLIAAGANGVRINMSHGTHEEKVVDIERARAAAAKNWDNLSRCSSIFPARRFAPAN
jgi:pyruvate kinase